MRVIGLLIVVGLLAAVLMQFRGSLTTTSPEGESTRLSDSVEEDVNKAVSGYQDKLNKALKQSGAD